MPNEVYTRTHHGLSTMISARAARRMLDAVLARRGVSTDTVDAATMTDLLMGPVLQGLQDVLPKDGLKRRLQALAGSLDAGDAPPPPASVNTPREDALRNDTPLPEHAPAETRAAAGIDSELRPETLEAAPGGPGSKGEAPVSREHLEAVALAFTELEQVVFVAAFEGDEVAFSRGAEHDLASLAALVPVGRRLLERGGALRFYRLTYEEGHVLIFPLGRASLMVIARPELSLDAALSTWAKGSTYEL